MSKQNPTTCNWCGNLVVGVATDENTKSTLVYEVQRDEKDRLLQAYDGTLIIGLEHRCKARCSGCRRLVIMEHGEFYDRPEAIGNSSATKTRQVHRCAR